MSKKSYPHKKNEPLREANVLGIGSAIVDWVIPVSEEFVSSIQGVKGGMQLLQPHEFAELYVKAGSPQTLSIGGSAANVIKGLSKLGSKTAFLGIIGDDEESELYQDAMRILDIEFFHQKSPHPTGRSLCLITPDTKRTLRTFLGANDHLNPSVLKPSQFEQRTLVHVEGYLANREGLLAKSMQLAQDADAEISLDLGSFEYARSYRKLFLELMTNYVDLLFCNAEEASALTGKQGEAACRDLLQFCPHVIVCNGADGGWAGNVDGVINYPAVTVKAIDTTGAGDFFTSGFLFGYLQRAPLAACAEIGAKVASEVVKVFGTDLPHETWQEIKTWATGQIFNHKPTYERKK